MIEKKSIRYDLITQRRGDHGIDYERLQYLEDTFAAQLAGLPLFPHIEFDGTMPDGPIHPLFTEPLQDINLGLMPNLDGVPVRYSLSSRPHPHTVPQQVLHASEVIGYRRPLSTDMTYRIISRDIDRCFEFHPMMEVDLLGEALPGNDGEGWHDQYSSREKAYLGLCCFGRRDLEPRYGMLSPFPVGLDGTVLWEKGKRYDAETDAYITQLNGIYRLHNPARFMQAVDTALLRSS